jgi:allophanate hydrolase subunit 2
VSFLGFAPGFAYLRGLDPALATLPRRASPRPAVPAFVVAVAAGMSAIYPAASPGGWNLLGRALHFDPLLEPFSVGQEVRFRAVAPEAREQALAREQPASREQVARAEIVEIAAIAGPTLVVDGEPRRRLADGCPRGGPLAPSLARCALRAVGAAHDDALLERHGSVTLVLGGARPRRVADESGRVREIAPGTACTFAAPRETRVGYVAIEGGLDVPVVLGGRGTLLSVRRGGHEGRALRRGDRLALGLTTLERARRNDTSMDDLRSTRENLLRASAGPDLAGDATRSIRARVAHVSDRSGTRLALLEPHGLATREARSAPVVQGAIQATPSGELIVLGPDHPVTGGYPVVGILDAAACDALFARPLGSEVALCIMP